MKEEEIDIWSIELLDAANKGKSDLIIRTLGMEFKLTRKVMRVMRAYGQPTDLKTCLQVSLAIREKSRDEIKTFITKATEAGAKVEVIVENTGKPLRLDSAKQPAVAAMMNSAIRTEVNKQV
ncbi:MAG: hypothetical protein K6A67_05065 [Bacteroidales bacterium]|nr:hypothetical protein [Bacteroidales bacterium]